MQMRVGGMPVIRQWRKPAPVGTEKPGGASGISTIRFGQGSERLSGYGIIKNWYDEAQVIADRRRSGGRGQITHLDLLAGIAAVASGQQRPEGSLGQQMLQQAVSDMLTRAFDLSEQDLPKLASNLEALALRQDLDFDASSQMLAADIDSFLRKVSKPITSEQMVIAGHYFLNAIVQGGLVYPDPKNPAAKSAISLSRIQLQSQMAAPVNPPTGKDLVPVKLPAPQPMDMAKLFPVFSQFSTNLTQEAREGRNPDVLLRREAVQRMIATLNSPGRRGNLMLQAPSGEGKTYVTYGLAQRLADDDVPDGLKGSELVQWDVGSLVAGTRYRGDFEDRVKKILDELKNFAKIHPERKMLVFIDEIHSIGGAGSAEGALDLVNMLKSSGVMEQPNIRFIGATTPEDFRNSALRKDRAVNNRFTELSLPPFSQEQVLSLLAHQAGRAEEKLRVHVPADAIETILKEVKLHYSESVLRRAEGVLDTACSLALGDPLEVSHLQDARQQKEIWLKALERQTPDQLRNRKFKRQLTELPDELAHLDQQIAQLKDRPVVKTPDGRPVVTEQLVRQALAIVTGNDLALMGKDEIQKLYDAPRILNEQVVGQEEAVATVGRALKAVVRRGKSGKPVKRPILNMLFVGPSSSGKTMTAKIIADQFADGQLIIENMGQLKGETAIKRLTGADPGYIGFDSVEALTEKVSKRPRSVILFDEIEKADPAVLDLLLQIMEEGEVQDNRGKTVSFRNTIIIMTSNLKQKELREALKKKQREFQERQGLRDPLREERALDGLAKKILEADEGGQGLKRELLNRMNYVVPFNPITRKHVRQIYDNLLRDLNESDDFLKNNNIRVALTESARKRLVDLAAENIDAPPARSIGFGAPDTNKAASVGKEDDVLESGAREVRQLFEDYVEQQVYDEMILNEHADAVLTLEFDEAGQDWRFKREPVKPAGSMDVVA